MNGGTEIRVKDIFRVQEFLLQFQHMKESSLSYLLHSVEDLSSFIPHLFLSFLLEADRKADSEPN